MSRENQPGEIVQLFQNLPKFFCTLLFLRLVSFFARSLCGLLSLFAYLSVSLFVCLSLCLITLGPVYIIVCPLAPYGPSDKVPVCLAQELLPLTYDRKLKDLVFFFKCLNGCTDLNVRGFVSSVSHSQTRLSTSYILKTPVCKTSSFQVSYFNCNVNFGIICIWKLSSPTSFPTIESFHNFFSRQVSSPLELLWCKLFLYLENCTILLLSPVVSGFFFLKIIHHVLEFFVFSFVISRAVPGMGPCVPVASAPLGPRRFFSCFALSMIVLIVSCIFESYRILY